MHSSMENTGTLERRLTVQVPADQIDTRIQLKLRELSKQVRIKGFRPGRIPMKVMQQRYGKQVRRDVIGEMLQLSLQEAIVENDVRPVAMPQVTRDEQAITVRNNLQDVQDERGAPALGQCRGEQIARRAGSASSDQNDVESVGAKTVQCPN